MSTNFLQFNPSLINAESDSAYSADSLRTGGIPSAAIFPSTLANKLFYQSSTFVAAFCQMLVNKGLSPSDANVANLAALLANVRLASDFLTSIITIAYATSVTFPAGTSAQFDLALTGNVTASALTGQSAGQLLGFIVSQDGVGGRSFVWPSALTAPGPICQIPNSTSIQYFIVRPGGAIEPIGQMTWITPAGLRVPTAPNVINVNSTGTVSSAFQAIVEKADASAGVFTRNLYTAVGFNGFQYTCKKMDSNFNNPITVQPAGGQTIDGQSNFQVSRQFDALTIISDGANWIII